MIIAPRKVILDFGKTGTGKSRLAKKLQRNFERVITLDPLAEYTGTCYNTFEELVTDFLEHCFYENTSFNIVCRFYDENDVEGLFELCEIVGNLCLTIEEFSIYFRDRKKFLGLERLVSQGRHFRVSLLLISQRVPELAPSLRAQKSSIFTFQQDEPNDLKMLESFGFSPDSVRTLIPYNTSEEMPTKNYHYLVIGEDVGEIEKNKLQPAL